MVMMRLLRLRGVGVGVRVTTRGCFSAFADCAAMGYECIDDLVLNF
jgi:hypothetical protein